MGLQIGVHAIGDKGNNWISNAYEKHKKRTGNATAGIAMNTRKRLR